jgi:hypothetical protein
MAQQLHSHVVITRMNKELGDRVKNIDMETRLVEGLGRLQLQKLVENRSEGGWKDETPRDLFNRLGEELRELGKVIDAIESVTEAANAVGWSDGLKTADEEMRQKVGLEAAGVANFAAMIADVVGALKAS